MSGPRTADGETCLGSDGPGLWDLVDASLVGLPCAGLDLEAYAGAARAAGFGILRTNAGLISVASAIPPDGLGSLCEMSIRAPDEGVFSSLPFLRSVEYCFGGAPNMDALLSFLAHANATGAALACFVQVGDCHPNDLENLLRLSRDCAPNLRVSFRAGGEQMKALTLARIARDLGFDLVEGTLCAVERQGRGGAPLEQFAFERATAPESLAALEDMCGHVGGEFSRRRLLEAYWSWLCCPLPVREALSTAADAGACIWQATWEWAFGRTISQSDHARVIVRRLDTGDRRIRKLSIGKSDGFERELTAHTLGTERGQPLAPVLSAGEFQCNRYYELPYYVGGTLRDRLRVADFCGKPADEHIAQCIRSLCEDFFAQPGSRRPDEFARSALIQRPLARLEGHLESASRHAALDDGWRGLSEATPSEVGAVFNAIATADVIDVDGVLVAGPLPLFAKLSANLDTFTPPSGSIRQIHGDAHFGNIMFDEQERPVFLDSGGFLEGADVAYDLGKITFSLQWHDVYLDDLCQGLEMSSTSGRIRVRGHRRTRNAIHAVRLAALRSKALPHLYARTTEVLADRDMNLEHRANLYAGVHQIAMATTLIRRFGWRSVAIFVEGLLMTQDALAPGAGGNEDARSAEGIRRP